jgi:hypothetical protein
MSSLIAHLSDNNQEEHTRSTPLQLSSCLPASNRVHTFPASVRHHVHPSQLNSYSISSCVHSANCKKSKTTMARCCRPPRTSRQPRAQPLGGHQLRSHALSLAFPRQSRTSTTVVGWPCQVGLEVSTCWTWVRGVGRTATLQLSW